MKYADISVSSGTACSPLACPAAMPSVESSSRAARAPASGSTSCRVAPLSMTARWKSPLADGMVSSVDTFRPPPDCPKIITVPGSPPNSAMLSRTHSSARTMSSMPTSPDAANSDPPTDARFEKPSTLRRWLMLTTTTSPRRARLAPSVTGDEPEPVTNPPPWHQNITGRLRLSFTAGVQMFSTRQSSPSAGSPAAATAIADAARRAPGSVCGALGPYARASRTPVHFAGAAGGMNRFAPPVLAPYGTPLKTLMPRTSSPRMRP